MKENIKELIEILKGSLDELESFEDDSKNNKVTAKILSNHCECMDNNMKLVEELSSKVVTEWRRDAYDRKMRVKNKSVDELIELHR